MKLRAFLSITAILMAGSLSAQTMTDVINEFNVGVEKLNNQEYEVSVEHFNQVLALAESVGDEANDMRAQAQEQIPSAYYRQATVFMKRKQYDNAIPYLEKTIELSTLYGNNDEINEKSKGYLPQLHMMEGSRHYKNEQFEEALDHFDKALAMDETLYKAHLGKGMIFLDQSETDMMQEEFKVAKEAALAENDTKTVELINGKIDGYYNKFITDEMEMVDPEENDYTYVIEACENALRANPENPRALYHLALVSNKAVEYDAAIDYGLKALQFETEPVWISAINFELGTSYQNTAAYDKACEVLKKVMEEPFLSRAEKKLESLPGCS
jgi:tetratricopeptide (TPR) repeat protein